MDTLNAKSIYFFSIPNVKLYYPEPYIATASFLHTDMWFTHIIIYQYWLWFVFIFLICFFLITFLCTLRWSNIRYHPKRETRGVSRSKCADLITATVPVSWAISILIHETTDAIDFYDGYGTTEMILGIRAYQWGWEYYYPKDLSLYYNVKSTQNLYIGNSLKYFSSTSKQNSSNFYWLSLLPAVNTVYWSSQSSLFFNQPFIFKSNAQINNPIELELHSYKLSRLYSSFFWPVSQQSLFFLEPTTTQNYLDWKVSLFSQPTSNYLPSLMRSNFLDLKFVLNNSTSHLLSFFNNSITSLKKILTYTTNLTNRSNSLLSLPLKYNFFLDQQMFQNSFNFSVALKTPELNEHYFVITPTFVAQANNLVLSNNTNTNNNISKSLNINKNDNISPTTQNTDFSLQWAKKPLTIEIPFETNHTSDSSSIWNPYQLTETQINPVYSFTSCNILNNRTSVFYSLMLSFLKLHQTSPFFNFSLFYDYDYKHWQEFDFIEDFILETGDSTDFWIEEQVLAKIDLCDIMEKQFEFLLQIWDNSLNSKYGLFFFLKKFTPITKIWFVNSTTFNWSGLTMNDVNIVYENKILLNSIDILNEMQYKFKLYSNQFVCHTNLLNIYKYQSINTNFLFSHFTSTINEIDFFKNYAWSYINNSFQLSLFFFYKYPFINQFSNSLSSVWQFNENSSLALNTKQFFIYNTAIQKVLRSLFDELHSLIFPKYFTQSNSAHFFVNQPLYALPKLINKQLNNYANIIFSHTLELPVNISNYSLSTLLNLPLFTHPFLIAYTSGASKFLWFDWWAKWELTEVQPISHSRSTLYGMNFLTQKSNYNTSISSQIIETEQYISRLNRIRRYTLPNWLTSPFIIKQDTTALVEDLYSNYYLFVTNKFTKLNLLFKSLRINYFTKTNLNLDNFFFFINHSNVNSWGRNFWYGGSSFNSYTYSLSVLGDILTKRLTILQKHSLYNYEQDYNLYSDFQVLLKTKLYKSYTTLFLVHSLNKSNQILDLFSLIKKAEYKPLRKGILNMIRLHATGAIALPVEIRIQVLASSKDVIHSWAIPSGGIKIDCVPGYSSHRVFLFLNTGIFWGQCMEICGRYHHWMPIILYFMKRDLFLLWVTHFVFQKQFDSETTFVNNQLPTSFTTVSYSNNLWAYYLNL